MAVRREWCHVGMCGKVLRDMERGRREHCRHLDIPVWGEAVEWGADVAEDFRVGAVCVIETGGINEE